MALETAGRTSIVEDTTKAEHCSKLQPGNIGGEEKTEEDKERSLVTVMTEQSMSVDMPFSETVKNTEEEKKESEKKSENISSQTNSQPIWLSSVLFSKGPRAYGIRSVGESVSNITSTNGIKKDSVSVSKMTDRGASVESINTGTCSSSKKECSKNCEKTGNKPVQTESPKIDGAVSLPTKSQIMRQEDQKTLQTAMSFPQMPQTRDQLRYPKHPKFLNTNNRLKEAKAVHKVRSDEDLVTGITEIDKTGSQDLNSQLNNDSKKQTTSSFADVRANFETLAPKSTTKVTISGKEGEFWQPAWPLNQAMSKNPGNSFSQKNESMLFFNTPAPMFTSPFGFTPLPNVPIPEKTPKFYGKHQWKGETQELRVNLHPQSLEQQPFDLQEQGIQRNFVYPTAISSSIQDMPANEKYSGDKGEASYLPFFPSSFPSAGIPINPSINQNGPWSGFGTTVCEPQIVPEPLESPRKKVKAPIFLKELQKQSSLDDADGLRKLRLKAARNRAKAAIQMNRESIGMSSGNSSPKISFPGNSSHGNSFPGPDTLATFSGISQRDGLYPQGLTAFSDTLPTSPNFEKTNMLISSFNTQKPAYFQDMNWQQPMYMESYGNRPLQSYNFQATGNSYNWGFHEEQIGAVSVGHSSTGPTEMVPDGYPTNGLKIEIPDVETASEKVPSNVDSFMVDACTLNNIQQSPTGNETDFSEAKRQDKTLMEVSRRLLGDEESMEEVMEEKQDSKPRVLSSNIGSQYRSTELTLDVNGRQNSKSEKPLEDLLVKDVERKLENCLKEGSQGNNGMESGFEAVLQLDLDNSQKTSKNESESKANFQSDPPLHEESSMLKFCKNYPSPSETRQGYKLNGMSYKSLLVEDSGEQNNLQNHSQTIFSSKSLPARLPSSNSQTSSIRSAGDSGSFSEEEAGEKGENENGEESCMDGVEGGENQMKGLLFEKSLTKTDTGGLGRIILPKRAAEKHLPPVDHKEGVNVEMGDGFGRTWVFRLRFWQNKSRMYVLEGAGEYMRAHGLQVGDRICFCQCEEGKLLLLPIKGLHSLPPSFSSSSTTPPTSSSHPSPSPSLLLPPEASSRNTHPPYGPLPPFFDIHTNNTNNTTTFHGNVPTCFPPPPPLPPSLPPSLPLSLPSSLPPPPEFLVPTHPSSSTSLFPSQTTLDVTSPSLPPSPSPGNSSRPLTFPHQSYFDNFPSHRPLSQILNETSPGNSLNSHQNPLNPHQNPLNLHQNLLNSHPNSFNSYPPYSTTPRGIETPSSRKMDTNPFSVGVNPLGLTTLPSSVSEKPSLPSSLSASLPPSSALHTSSLSASLPPSLSRAQVPGNFPPNATQPSGLPPTIPSPQEDKSSVLNTWPIPRVRLKSGEYLAPEIVATIMQHFSISKRKKSLTELKNCDQSALPFPFISGNDHSNHGSLPKLENLENLGNLPPSLSPSSGPTDLTLGGAGSSSSVEMETNPIENNSLSDMTSSEVMADCGVSDDPELAALLAGEENNMPDTSECNNPIEIRGQTLERCPSLATTEACLALMGSFDLPGNPELDFPKSI